MLAKRALTCEVTRRGMTEPEMSKMAELLKRALLMEKNQRALGKMWPNCAEFHGTECCFEK